VQLVEMMLQVADKVCDKRCYVMLSLHFDSDISFIVSALC
jgi:hypothetical protein